MWVDEQDLVIVKTMGKWVTETGDVTASDLPFTVFETYRQQVGKNLWFPAYARSDETIQSGDAHVPIRVIVKWSDFTPQSGAAGHADSPLSLSLLTPEEPLSFVSAVLLPPIFNQEPWPL